MFVERRTSSAPGAATEWLHALRNSSSLETGTDLLLDAVVHRAAILFNAPIAVVSLRAEARRAFRAIIGLGVPLGLEDLAFCGDAMVDNEPWFCLDPGASPSFAKNHVVHAQPGVRFYAAAPVRGPADRLLGALCVMDRRTRAGVTAEEMASMKALAVEAASIFATPLPIEMKPERNW